MMKTSVRIAALAAMFSVLTHTAAAQAPLGTAFTYQGHLKEGGQPVNNTADFQFTLWDAESAGNPIGAMSPVDNVTVADGLFTVEINANNEFGGDAFNGEERWLEIAVRSPAGGGQFSTLTPRQPITAAPYALKVPGVDGHSLNAADGSPVDALFVNNDGKVGIGTTTPEATLQVLPNQGGPTPGEGIRVMGTSPGVANQSYLSFSNSVGTAIGYVGDGSGGDDSVFLASYIGDAALATPAGRVLTATASGNVGIGTTTPIARLDVRGGAMLVENLGDQADLLWLASERSWVFRQEGTGATAALKLESVGGGGNKNLIIKTSGAVGIGTSTPSRRLTVWDTMSVEASPGFLPFMGVPRPGTTTPFRASMFIDPQGDGVVFGDRKSFREVNPEDPATDIWYVCIEGPEAAMYVRGTATLENGRARIELPSHFRSLAAEKGMTVQLTPLSAQSRGLAVTRKALNGVEVAELADGRGTYEFDWEVKAVRKRYEDYQVIKPWDEVLPSDSDRTAEWNERLRDIKRDR